ncbi:hypothetical protein [Bradyrhizobium cajani]|nr:hypothetical protein [Bradyrhizobium cajani]
MAAGLLIGLVVGILRTTAPRWVSVPLRLVLGRDLLAKAGLAASG